MASSATTRRGNGANNEKGVVTVTIQQLFPLLVVVSDAIFVLYTHCHVRMREIALRTLLQGQRKPVYQFYNLHTLHMAAL